MSESTNNNTATTKAPVPTNLTPGNTVVIDTSHIYQHPSNNPRTSYSDDNWDRLVNDLRTLGQLFPVTARLRCEHDGPDTEGFLLVMEDGHSRAKARKEMGVDRDETGRRADDLSVTIKPSIEDRVLARLQAEAEGLEPAAIAGLKAKLVKEEKAKVSRESHSVNTARESWNSWAEANSLKTQLVIQKDLNPDLSDKDLENLVGEINGMKGDLVRMRLSLLDSAKTPSDIQDKLKAGELSYSEAIELRRITDKEIREDLAEKSYLEGWSANMLKKKIDKKAKEAEASGNKIKASRTRTSSKKNNANLRTEETLINALSEIKDAVSSLEDEEEDLLNQLLGAIAFAEWVMTPQAQEDFLDMLDQKVEAYFDGEEDSEDEEEVPEDQSETE
mgnify:CR=1 FL=1